MPQTIDYEKKKLVKEYDSRPKSTKNWYVFYTAPRAEKVVRRELVFKDYEVFLPIVKTMRVWKNRQRKMIEQVLFPGYIFVYTEERNVHKVSQTNKVKTFIHCAGKPSIIDAKCIDGIRKMLKLDSGIEVEPDFCEGENVRVTAGPLVGYEGILLKQKSRTRFGIHLKEINQTVSIDICTDMIEKR